MWVCVYRYVEYFELYVYFIQVREMAGATNDLYNINWLV